MAKYVLDSKGADVMRLSNDAFLYLTQEEEPLDEDNLLEARQLCEDFPLGFEITSYRYVEDGLVEVVIVPYVEAPEPIIVTPKIKKAPAKKKQDAIRIKESTMSEKELTADFFRHQIDAIYAKRKRLSSDDILWLKNASLWFRQENNTIYLDKIKSLMAS